MILLLSLIAIVSAQVPHDQIFQAKCQAHCHDHSQGLNTENTASEKDAKKLDVSNNFSVTLARDTNRFLRSKQKNKCNKECMEKLGDKLGNCPKEPPGKFTSCLEVCSTDISCPGIDKCCKHSCGTMCHTPDFEGVQGLPEIPVNVTIHEKRKSRLMVVRWDHEKTDSGTVLYIVEERISVAVMYRESEMGQWASSSKAPKKGPPLKLPLVPGRWYQVRVAAVNANGTKGFSPPSRPLRLSIPPKKPSAPSNLTFETLGVRNNTLWGILSWNEPPSDLPITKYKVLWSKRIASDHVPQHNGSLCVLQKIVHHKKNSIKLRNLEIGPAYYLQVEAQSQYGPNKLSSEKGWLTINSTVYAAMNGTRKTPRSGGRHPGTLKMAKLKRIGGTLSTKIIWDSKSHTDYSITVVSDGNKKCGNKFQKVIAGEASPFEVRDLKYGCKYTVIVKEMPAVRGKKERKLKVIGKLTFTTQTCTNSTSSTPC